MFYHLHSVTHLPHCLIFWIHPRFIPCVKTKTNQRTEHEVESHTRFLTRLIPSRMRPKHASNTVRAFLVHWSPAALVFRYTNPICCTAISRKTQSCPFQKQYCLYQANLTHFFFSNNHVCCDFVFQAYEQINDVVVLLLSLQIEACAVLVFLSPIHTPTDCAVSFVFNAVLFNFWQNSLDGLKSLVIILFIS